MEKGVSNVTTEVSAKTPAAKVDASASAPAAPTDDTPKAPTLAELRDIAKKVAPWVKIEKLDPTPETEKDGKKIPAHVGHVAASFGNKRVSHAVHEGCSADEAEAIVLRSVIAHHGG